MDILESGFTIVDSNQTGSVACTSDSFEGADPSPDTAKQCFCDDKKYYTSANDIATITDYYRQATKLATTESEIKDITAQIKEDKELDDDDEDVKDSKEKASLAQLERYILPKDLDDGEADATAAGCVACDSQCSANTEKSLTTEIERQKQVIVKKYNKLQILNKRKRITAHNKKVTGDNFCTAAQKAKDPAEKKKFKRQCTDLRSEASKITIEAQIEYTNIVDQQKTEEHVLQEEITKVTHDSSSKSVTSTMVTEINKASIKEQQATRIQRETEERISVIKKKIETQKIEEQTYTEQTTAIEKQVSTIQTQIEEVQKQLIKEIKYEKEESLEVTEEEDTTTIEAEAELTKEIESKKTELEEVKTKVTSKIETLTSKTTDLEETIEKTTKKITDIKTKIDRTNIQYTTNVKRRNEIKQQIKIITSVEEKVKIQEEIDELTTKIVDEKKEIETLTEEKETQIIEETTARTELTYTSQNLKKVTNYKEHVEEQLVVTNVVIDSKKE
jgi:hypothetical protein